MKKNNRNKDKQHNRRLGLALLLIVILGPTLVGCGQDGSPLPVAVEEEHQNTDLPAGSENRTETGEAGPTIGSDGLPVESAQDGIIDFDVLKAYNPEIFAWLYVPGTDIDRPILQSGVADDYYISHTADGKTGAAGALYTEMPNLMNMCDFNTIIHGKDDAEGALFYDLYQFEDSDFFAEHDTFYIYLPDNLLTYTIVAAYHDEGSDILRRHDYTTLAGCQDYLTQMYGTRAMGKNLRNGWEGLSPYHFLVTLDGDISADGQSQYVVIGVLAEDAAGTIERVILD